MFLSILSGIFLVIYRQSDKKGFRRWWISFKMAAFIAATLAGLITPSTEVIEAYVPNNSFSTETVLSNQEFYSLEENDRHVILAKAEGYPVTPPTRVSGPSNLPTTGGRPSRNVPGLNPYRVAPKIVDQGLGAGGGGGNDNFDDSGPSSQKQNLDEICSEHPSFYSDKKKSDEQCELEEEVKSEVKIDFDFVSDQKGDPILLIPDNKPLLADKDRFIKVDHEQTKTHLHHAEDLGINLPDDFDMNHYENLDREGRIDYANQNVPRETIIECQNEIGKALTEDNPTHVDGFIGKYKKMPILK